MRGIDDIATEEKILAIKEFILEGKTFEQISVRMRKRKGYKLSGFDGFMKRNSEAFKDIVFVKRKK